MIGANYAPTKFFTNEADGQSYCNSYLGDSYQWLRNFKEGGSTLPWAEDWQWQTPLGTQQMVALPLTVQRASMTRWPPKPSSPSAALTQSAGGAPKQKWGKNGRPPQMYYLLPEFPGEHPINWRRNMYAMVGHGVKIFDLFQFRTSQSGVMTCDYTDNDFGSFQAIRQGLNEMGMIDDLVAKGIAQPYAQAALLYSETADIWLSSATTSAGAAKRALFIALRHAQLAVDVLTEEDCAETDALSSYSALYIVDPQVAEKPSERIAEWVTHGGGHLVVTCAGASLNESNSSNLAMGALLTGLERQTETYTGNRFSRFNSTIFFVKENLPWAERLDVVVQQPSPTSVNASVNGNHVEGLDNDCVHSSWGVFGEKPIARLTPADADAPTHEVLATFESDGSPAELRYPTLGRGKATVFLYHPGFSYFQPATPKRPVRHLRRTLRCKCT
eukprot:COSAG05_NODE_608_length_8372_cov_2.996615_3_plen_444_part_00